MLSVVVDNHLISSANEQGAGHEPIRSARGNNGMNWLTDFFRFFASEVRLTKELALVKTRDGEKEMPVYLLHDVFCVSFHPNEYTPLNPRNEPGENIIAWTPITIRLHNWYVFINEAMGEE